MNAKNILVLGSGPQSKIKGFTFHKIYTSNASVIKSREYISSENKIEINSVNTLNSLLSDIPTKKNVNLIKPNRIIIRRGDQEKFPEIDFEYSVKTFNKKEQWKFQAQFFNYSYLMLFISELFYGNSFQDKYSYLKKCIIHQKGFLGISTGFFALLLALFENPNDKIFISGISMENSKHFYKLIGKENKIMTRHKIDNFMINFLKKDFKKRMLTNDRQFSEIAQITLI